ncbi:MAG: ceramidase domain-containing protein, partial [Acidobacteria bacterium]|nr:ceramidase domain-containing protein [Acidobacteriota bacterium]
MAGNTPSLLETYWRHLLMLIIVVGSFTLILSLHPFGQNPEYHNFADRRAFFGIPNFLDVASNLAFLIVGIIGLKICFKNYLGSMRNAWIILFAGITLVSVGSAYYHLNPNNQTLVWDRLPMTIGFMGLFAALLGEYISEQLGRYILIPALLLGFSSVIYWHLFDDLRFYIWIQLIPLLTIPVIMILY